jgi:hypothetical protein
MGVVIEHMGYVDTDPLRGLLGLLLYKDAGLRLTSALAEMNAVFVSDGVVLNEKDPGYTLYKISVLGAKSATTP